MSNSIASSDSATSTGFDRYFPSALLVTVAMVQIFLVNFHTLSPWKGGGFGMFAAVDSPGMRTLDGTGTLSSGDEVRLDVFGSLEPELTLRQQSVPSPRELQLMADGLVTREWVPISLQSRAVLSRIKAENPDAILPQEAFLQLDEPFYRVRTEDDPETHLPPLKLEDVRLRWWKLVWNADNSQISTVPIGPEVQSRQTISAATDNSGM